MRTVVGAVSFDQGLQEAWDTVAGVAPLVFVFGLILVAGGALAALASAGTVRVLRRTGFDRAVERGGIGRALANSRVDATQLLGRIVLYGLLLFTFQFAFGVFGENPVSELLASIVAYLPKVFLAIVIIVVAASIGAAVRDVVGSALAAVSYGGALATAAAVTVVAIGVFAALDQLEIAPAIVLGLFYALLAVVAGSAIVAIGGAGIQPMRAQWERALHRVEAEAPRVRAAAQQARREREQAEESYRLDLVAEEQRAVAEEQPAVEEEGAAPPAEQASTMPDPTPAYAPSTSREPTEELRPPPPTAGG